MSLKHLIDRSAHVGWITDRQDLFEAFWCDLLGYSLIRRSQIPTEMTETLFAIPGGAEVYLYGREKDPLLIEIHIFKEKAVPTSQSFNRFGINHFCLWVRDKVAFMNTLPDYKSVTGVGNLMIQRHIYENPGGWMNVFIRDFEGNWIEIRNHM